MFGNIYGLDLGTYEIKVYDKKKDNCWKEKNAVAITNKKTIFSVGDDAYSMYEKAPLDVQVVFPMKEGVISHFYNMQYLLENLIKQERHFTPGSKYLIAVPTDVTEVEKRAFYDLVVHSKARAKDVRIVERGIADAVGLGLDVKRSPGIFVVNLGAETTEVSVLSYGGVVLNRLIKFGGCTLDNAIMNTLRFNHEFLIGQLTAEMLRKTYGILSEQTEETVMAAGRNLLTRIPEQKSVDANVVRDAMAEPFIGCLKQIHFMLERIPPEVQRNIYKTGIYLVGGLSNLVGIDKFIENELHIKVHTISEPEFCAVNGLKKIFGSKELMKYTYSMLDENYRWMR